VKKWSFFVMNLALVSGFTLGDLCAAESSAQPQGTPVTSLPGTPPQKYSNLAPSKETPKDPKFRNFYEVLEDLMGDFEYDIKNGEVTGLKDLSIRNMALSENVPPSFKTHLEVVLTERIVKNARTRMIQCMACRAKRSTVSGDQVVITSPETNPVELARIAKLAGISNFMDVAFSYQPSGMVMSLTISEPETGSIVWSRSYNSETSRAAAFRRGVDYSQIDDARKQSEYVPTIQYRLAIYYMFEKNLSGYTGCMGAGFRMMERYDNRKKEVGFELDYFRDASTLTNSAAATDTNLWSGLNFSLMFMHAWNLIGGEENFNLARGSFFAGIGGTYASGYLGGLVRLGYEWRLAKHWAVSANLGYRPQATAFLPSGTTTGTAVSGAEFGIGINYLF
jgi:hypothetical protein